VNLFELQRNNEAKTEHDRGLLGFQRIRVLAIEPWRIEFVDRSEHDPDDKRKLGIVECVYAVETENGITQVCSSDLWRDIENGFYQLVTK
jgi:hypothetical protein